MKFLIVLAALAAVAAAKPGVLGGLGLGGLGYLGAHHAAPIAYSSVTHHAAPAVITHHATPAIAAPAIATAAIAAPAITAHHAAIAAPAITAHHVAPAVIAAPAVAGIKTQYHAQDALGQASYGHSEPFQAHTAHQDAHGNKVGSFSYVAPNGQVFKTDYIADALGYRVASNALPVGPGAGPHPVHDTPEVIAARAAHLALHHRGKRGIAAIGHTPAATAPLGHAIATPAISYAAPLAHAIAAPAVSVAAPLAYAAASPLAYHAPLTSSYAYSAPAYHHGLTSVLASPALSLLHHH